MSQGFVKEEDDQWLNSFGASKIINKRRCFIEVIAHCRQPIKKGETFIGFTLFIPSFCYHDLQ
jgi:hypothetical protein